MVDWVIDGEGRKRYIRKLRYYVGPAQANGQAGNEHKRRDRGDKRLWERIGDIVVSKQRIK